MTPQTKRRTLYVSDLDQTLLRSDGRVSAESVELLNNALETGALFTYATARSYSSSRKATAPLRLTLPVITYGGTITADPTTGSPADIRLLPTEVVVETLATSRNHSQTAPVLHTIEDGREWLRWDPERMTPGVSTFIAQRAGDRRLRPITASDPTNFDAVHYVSVLAGRDDLVAFRDAIAPALVRTAHFLSADAGTPGLDWLEFHHPHGTKAHAIRRLMDTLGADRLVVFGDNHNDVPMFEIADEAYAVENAVPELMAIASATIGHHETDAVARFIAADLDRE